MIKQYLHIILFLILLWQINISFASTYKDYIDNVTKVCNEWEYKKNKIYKNTHFYSSANEYSEKKQDFFIFESIKNIYRDTQNSIYKCGMYQAQINAYDRVISAIKIEKNWLLNEIMGNTINSKKSLLIKKIKDNNCKIDSKVDTKETLSKHQILDQSTYELCNYIFYLDYLETWYYNDIKVLGWFDEWNTKDQVEILEIINKSNIKQSIENEKQHSYEMYNMAFNAFSQYDSFLAIHIMLEIIKQDYIVFRDTLYSEISPINQVWYKIINAMSK